VLAPSGVLGGLQTGLHRMRQIMGRSA